MTADQLGEVAYEMHALYFSGGKEIWAWQDVPEGSKELWVRIALGVIEAAETGEKPMFPPAEA